MLGRILSCSLKVKIAVLLLWLGFFPLLLLGGMSNYVINNVLHKTIDSHGQKSIDAMALNTLNELQSLMDKAYYYSTNVNIAKELEREQLSPGDCQQAYESIANEIRSDFAAFRANYVFQYFVIDWDGIIYTDKTYIPNQYNTGKELDTLMEEPWIQTLRNDIVRRSVLLVDSCPLFPYSGEQVIAASNVILDGKCVGAVVFLLEKEIITKSIYHSINEQIYIQKML